MYMNFIVLVLLNRLTIVSAAEPLGSLLVLLNR